MPSSSFVEVEVGVEVEIEVGVESGVEVEDGAEAEVGVQGLRVGVGLTFSVGWVEWVGGWLEFWRIKVISTQVVVEVEV